MSLPEGIKKLADSRPAVIISYHWGRVGGGCKQKARRCGACCAPGALMARIFEKVNRPRNSFRIRPPGPENQFYAALNKNIT